MSVLTAVVAADLAVRRAAPAGLSGPEDPFGLILPPLAGSSPGSIDPAALTALAGLYLTAELEQAGVPSAAELLVAHRASLDLTSLDAARLLEDFADVADGWLPEPARADLYARLFGLGPGASRPGALVNTDFSQLLADLCSAITAYDQVELSDRPAPSHWRSQLARAVGRLRNNLALHQHGSTLVVGKRITDQMRRSVELLGHPGIVALVRGHTMWDVVRATWDPREQPDLDALVGRGQAGQQLIGWLGSPEAQAGEPSPAVREAAAAWLVRAGFDEPVAVP